MIKDFNTTIIKLSINKSKYPCSNTSSKYIPYQTLEEMFGNLDYDVEASDDEYF